MAIWTLTLILFQKIRNPQVNSSASSVMIIMPDTINLSPEKLLFLRKRLSKQWCPVSLIINIHNQETFPFSFAKHTAWSQSKLAQQISPQSDNSNCCILYFQEQGKLQQWLRAGRPYFLTEEIHFVFQSLGQNSRQRTAAAQSLQAKKCPMLW